MKGALSQGEATRNEIIKIIGPVCAQNSVSDRQDGFEVCTVEYVTLGAVNHGRDLT